MSSRGIEQLVTVAVPPKTTVNVRGTVTDVKKRRVGMAKLPNCPWCGSEPELGFHSGCREDSSYVECSKCSLCTPTVSDRECAEKKAARLWVAMCEKLKNLKKEYESGD